MNKQAFLTFTEKPVPLETPMGQFFLRHWSVAEREEYSNWFNKHKEQMAEVEARAIVMTICDEDGNKVFDGKDIPAIRQMPATVLDGIFEACVKHNSADKPAISAAQEIEKKD